MYWIYLAIFAVIVFIPGIVGRDYGILTEVQVEEYLILLLGSVGFLIFLLQGKMLKRVNRQRSSVQREANQLLKDLTHTYSYIGEANRKLDILRKVVQDIPEGSTNNFKTEATQYNSIMDAVLVMTKAPLVGIRFFAPGGEVIKEVWSDPKRRITTLTRLGCKKGQSSSETDDYLAVSASINPRGVGCCLLISKHNPHARPGEDMELLKALAAHALFSYMFFESCRRESRA
ncbi:MAG TPA: hypothetical protein PKA31_02725 [Candidatus Moranbacteria bacterium]|nr:hypothetical protein [Candidatus Moranbacteria bacterium]